MAADHLSPSAAPRASRSSVEDEWFDALDGRVVRVGATCYSLAVVGVHSAGDVCVQLAIFDGDDRGVVLRCVGGADPDDALRALQEYLAGNRHDNHVVVAHA